ncbi:MAG TPA: type II toxin-antitoxin system VapC family toxin [Promineifilum sp.]|nr:type II toxin-antitoxin system VapC family toxin [Promineifilum sp.]HRO91265.1 type II toxin-antitoxin system VapC family toxin [Promineifilum sp.]HRQ13674.1 type II toxin-antitoxin system VapC family toxin [Promineifilum sp.]
MNVVDSSGWLEYFTNSPNAAFFASPIKNQAELLVPVISIYEVFKRVLQQQGEEQALEVAAAMMQGMVTNLDVTTALSAARMSIEMKLPMADSIMLATARAHDAVLWTQDIDFAAIDGVQYVAKQ